MKNNVLVSFIFAISIVTVQFADAQRKTTKPVAIVPPAQPYRLFFEKVYLQTDREYYATGDDIWFKAYLVNAVSNYATYTSNNLYVDLISPDSKIIDREIIRLDSGMGAGDFKLTDSIPEGIYHIKAYTNWMRNFGDNFIFDKAITVHSVAGITPDNEVTDGDDKLKKSKKNISKFVQNSYKISVFPEGGSLITGVASIVGFKAEDALGNGTKVRGSVVSSKGDTLAHFESTAIGLGSFTLLPDSGVSYSVVGNYKNGSSFNVRVPSALSEGYALHVKTTDSSIVQVIISTNQYTLNHHKGKTLTIVAQHAVKSYFSASFELSDLQSGLSIPKADLPAGISNIILYDETSKPNCERLIYEEGNNKVKLKIATDKAVYAPKEKSTVTITVTDAMNKPVKAELSLAAVDVGIVPYDGMNIQSYLLLQSEVRGKIENAAQYFNQANPNRFKQMDLLLLTQGWRDFVWKRIIDTTKKISFLPESGFTISGRLRTILINKPIANKNITLFAPGAKGGKMFVARTDSAGKYFLDGIQLYGNQTLKLSARDDKGNKTGWLLLDTPANDPVPVKYQPIIKEDPSPQLALFNANSSARIKEANRFKVSGVIQLKEVTVRSAPSTMNLRGQVVQGFGYPEYYFDITAKDYTYKDLEDFLTQKIPGAQSNPDGEGIMFYYGGKKLFPKFLINKVEDVFDRIDYYHLTMDQVISVKYDHMVTLGGGDIMLISLVLKPGAFDKKDFSLVNTDVTGYYNARTFYAPNYEYSSSKSDQRITLHWEPMISTDENGQATITYYNADPKSKINVVVQGLSNKGVPLAANVTYNVK